MKIFKLIILIFSISLLFQCSDQKKKIDAKSNIKKDSETSLEKKNKIEKKVKKRWDSLNKNNVEDFFTEYGKQNKETKVIIYYLYITDTKSNGICSNELI